MIKTGIYNTLKFIILSLKIINMVRKNDFVIKELNDLKKILYIFE